MYIASSLKVICAIFIYCKLSQASVSLWTTSLVPSRTLKTSVQSTLSWFIHDNLFNIAIVCDFQSAQLWRLSDYSFHVKIVLEHSALRISDTF
jgi:hypothetical protein